MNSFKKKIKIYTDLTLPYLQVTMVNWTLWCKQCNFGRCFLFLDKSTSEKEDEKKDTSKIGISLDELFEKENIHEPCVNCL